MEESNDQMNSCVTSQSSVDAQMETVIEHVVELGGCHQFSQALGHHEDKEKAVESIQREILGCRNAIESLAEVASQQPVLNESVVEPTTLVSNPQHNITTTETKIETHEDTERAHVNLEPSRESTNFESTQDLAAVDGEFICLMPPPVSEETQENSTNDQVEEKQADDIIHQEPDEWRAEGRYSPRARGGTRKKARKSITSTTTDDEKATAGDEMNMARAGDSELVEFAKVGTTSEHLETQKEDAKETEKISPGESKQRIENEDDKQPEAGSVNPDEPKSESAHDSEPVRTGKLWNVRLSDVESTQELAGADGKFICLVPPSASEDVPEEYSKADEMADVGNSKEKEIDPAIESPERASIHEPVAQSSVISSDETPNTPVNDDLTSKPDIVPEQVVMPEPAVTEKKEEIDVLDQPGEPTEQKTVDEVRQTRVDEKQADDILIEESAVRPARGRYSSRGRGGSRKRGRRSFAATAAEDKKAADDSEMIIAPVEDSEQAEPVKVDAPTEIPEEPKEVEKEDVVGAEAAEEEEAPPEESKQITENGDDKQPETEAANLEEPKSEPAQESEPARSGRSLRVRAPKRPIEEVEPEPQPAKKQLKRSRGQDGHNKTFEVAKKTPTIKLPARPRVTISISDPSTRPDSRYEVYDHDGGSNRKFKCHNCKYSTDRLNNIVFHHKRSNEFVSGVRCPGVLRAAEEQRAEITRLQQTPKSNKKRARSSINVSSPYYNKV